MSLVERIHQHDLELFAVFEPGSKAEPVVAGWFHADDGVA